MKNNFYSARELAKHPDFPYKSYFTVKTLILSGKLRASVKGKNTGKRYLIHQSAVDEFIEKMKCIDS